MSSKVGSLNPEIEEDSFNATTYLIEVLMNQINSIDLVRVTGINDDGTINVIPIVQEVTAGGEPVPVVEISHIRYIRWQAGTNAVIMTPEIGDVGLFCICKKDISNAENGQIASYRRWNLQDGIYLGGIFNLNVQPATKIEINTDITITGTNVNIVAETANIKANAINLGDGATQGVARIGDSVDLSTGKIVSGSSVVKSL